MVVDCCGFKYWLGAPSSCWNHHKNTRFTGLLQICGMKFGFLSQPNRLCETSPQHLLSFMKFVYQEHSLKPGIYKIVNVHTNRTYVGQAKEFKERWKGHRSSLLSNRHRNKFIQADFAKCLTLLGHDDFLEFYVLEVMEDSSKEERNKRQEWWISEVKKEGNCYNLLKGTSQTTHVFKNLESFSKQVSETMKMKWQDETYVDLMMLARIESGMYESVSQKAKNRWENNEFRQQMKTKMSSSVLQEARKQHGLKIAKKHAKNYGNVVSSTGEVVRIVNLTKFCRERGLSRSGFQQLFRGQLHQYKGWKLPS